VDEHRIIESRRYASRERALAGAGETIDGKHNPTHARGCARPAGERHDLIYGF
jgi:hypothetical protein